MAIVEENGGGFNQLFLFGDYECLLLYDCHGCFPTLNDGVRASASANGANSAAAIATAERDASASAAAVSENANGNDDLDVGIRGRVLGVWF